MDALPPPQPSLDSGHGSGASDASGHYVYAATDYRPRTDREVELCASASHIDYLYMVAVDASTISNVLRHFARYFSIPQKVSGE